MNFVADWISYLPTLGKGLLLSIGITLSAFALSLVPAVLLAVGASQRIAIVRWICIAVVEFGRGTPALVILYLAYYGLPQLNLTFAAITSSIFALAFTNSAYLSEVARAAIGAVPRGQTEAAVSLGMSKKSVFAKVVLPQALRIALPSAMTFTIILFQVTSLTFVVSVPELLSRAYSIASLSFKYTEVLTLTALLYAATTILLSRLVDRIERRLEVAN